MDKGFGPGWSGADDACGLDYDAAELRVRCLPGDVLLLSRFYDAGHAGAHAWGPGDRYAGCGTVAEWALIDGRASNRYANRGIRKNA